MAKMSTPKYAIDFSVVQNMSNTTNQIYMKRLIRNNKPTMPMGTKYLVASGWLTTVLMNVVTVDDIVTVLDFYDKYGTAPSPFANANVIENMDRICRIIMDGPSVNPNSVHRQTRNGSSSFETLARYANMVHELYDSSVIME
eukprot:111459_1